MFTREHQHAGRVRRLVIVTRRRPDLRPAFDLADTDPDGGAPLLSPDTTRGSDLACGLNVAEQSQQVGAREADGIVAESSGARPGPHHEKLLWPLVACGRP
jgi:hypothetical protein